MKSFCIFNVSNEALPDFATRHISRVVLSVIKPSPHVEKGIFKWLGKMHQNISNIKEKCQLLKNTDNSLGGREAE